MFAALRTQRIPFVRAIIQFKFRKRPAGGEPLCQFNEDIVPATIVEGPQDTLICVTPSETAFEAGVQGLPVPLELVGSARRTQHHVDVSPRPPPAESGGGGATTFANRARRRAAKPWTIGEALSLIHI